MAKPETERKRREVRAAIEADQAAAKAIKTDQNQSPSGLLNYSAQSQQKYPLALTPEHPDPAIANIIASMTFAGIPQHAIAKALKMGVDTIHRHYKYELETGQTKLVNRIAESLAQRALAGSDTAAIFLLKTRGMGQFNDRQTVDVNASVTVTHKAELLGELSRMLGKGITIDVEPEEEKPI